MPPEFFRKGRFDELFLVELPDDEERRRIFQIHLAKRGKLSQKVDILKLLKETDGYSGADIESVVKEAVELAFCAPSGEREVTTERLLEVIKSTKSISDTLKDKIETLREDYKKYNFKTANGKAEKAAKAKPRVEYAEPSEQETQRMRENVFAQQWGCGKFSFSDGASRQQNDGADYGHERCAINKHENWGT